MSTIDTLYNHVSNIVDALDDENIESSVLKVSPDIAESLHAEYAELGTTTPDTFCGLDLEVDDELKSRRFAISVSHVTRISPDAISEGSEVS